MFLTYDFVLIFYLLSNIQHNSIIYLNLNQFDYLCSIIFVYIISIGHVIFMMKILTHAAFFTLIFKVNKINSRNVKPIYSPSEQHVTKNISCWQLCLFYFRESGVQGYYNLNSFYCARYVRHLWVGKVINGHHIINVLSSFGVWSCFPT